MKPSTLLIAGLATMLLSGCGPQVNRSQAVYVLIDTSGTYAKEVVKAQSVVNYVLGNLQPGDSLAVARVKSRSFSEKDIVAKVNHDIVDILKVKQVGEQLVQQGALPVGDSPEEFAAYIKTEIQKWGAIVKSANIKAD